ncbi:MAG TPA: alpha/beta hydrolase [Stellaceae bacterium]|nr:alpha/beta hydrolase [Stellaceae bacterium]
MARPVFFYSEGTRLAGDIYLPADLGPGERRAGIVLCHGYTGVRDIYLPDNRGEILLADRQSAAIGARASAGNPAAVTQVPLEFVDDTLAFNPEWVVDRIAPRPALLITTDNDRLVPPVESEALYARAGEPKKLVVLKGFGHYEVYEGEAFRQVMDATIDWCREHIPAK